MRVRSRLAFAAAALVTLVAWATPPISTGRCPLRGFGPIFALTRGGPENATNVPSYFAYYTFFKKLQVGYGSAISTVLTLIIVVVAGVFIWWQARTERRDRGF